MKDIFKISSGIFIGVVCVIICLICISCVTIAISLGWIGSLLPRITPVPFIFETPMFSSTVTNEIFPTTTLPIQISEPGGAFNTEGLSITLIETELSSCFTSKYNNKICPNQGASFLWAHFKREDLLSSADLPIYSCFTITLLYQKNELNSENLGEYPNRTDWSNGGCNQLYGGGVDEGWVYFEVPTGIDISEPIIKVESYQGPIFTHEWRLIITD